MTELKIDTSDKVLVEINKRVYKCKKGFSKAQDLLALIDKALKDQKMQINDIKSIKINVGPGSFTGLRVGVSVANTLGWVLGIAVNGKDVKKSPIEPIYK